MRAGHVHRRLAEDPRFEVPWRPDLTVVLFRLRGTDERNRRLLADVNDTQRVFLSSTTVDGRFFLRLCVLSFRTHADRVEEALGIIGTAA